MTSARPLLSVVITLALTGCSSPSKEPSSHQTKAAAVSSNSQLAGVPSFLPPEPEIPTNISVFEALGNTDRYAGKRVQIAGAFGKELRGVFATREHAKLNLAEYGVALSADTCDRSKSLPWNLSDLEALDGEYVRVEARLSTKVKGEHGIFRVGLCDVTRIAEAGFVAKEVVDAGSRAAPAPAGRSGSTR